MTLLVNYANAAFRHAQQRNSQTGLQVAGFDRVASYKPADIDRIFYNRNATVLSQPRGNGYWLWKPYFIRRSLDLIAEGDCLFYCDAGAYFIAPIAPLMEICVRTGQDVIPFELTSKEAAWTKRDAFISLDCDSILFTQTPQRLASYILLRKSDFSINFIDEFLAYAQKECVLTDRENQMGLPNFPEFKDHRHDQSIFSLLTKKHGLSAFRDPSQYGNECQSLHPDSTYGQIIEATRERHDLLLLRLLRRTVGLSNPLGRWLLKL